jgi:hypothetical protein
MFQIADRQMQIADFGLDSSNMLLPSEAGARKTTDHPLASPHSLLNDRIEDQ